MKGKLGQISFFVLRKTCFNLRRATRIIDYNDLRYSESLNLLVLYFVIEADTKLKQFFVEMDANVHLF